MVFKITPRLKGGESTVEAETDPIYFSTSGGIMIIPILTIWSLIWWPYDLLDPDFFKVFDIWVVWGLWGLLIFQMSTSHWTPQASIWQI